MSSKYNIRLKFKNKDGGEEFFQLEVGSNIIGRGKPSFLNDARISRKHAEIIISDLGGVTYTQMGQNPAVLLRPENEPFKLQKGVYHTLQNSDSISIYDGASPFTVLIESQDPEFDPMSLNDDDIATQQLDCPDDTSVLDYLKNTTTTTTPNNNNNNNTILSPTKRPRDDQQQINNENNLKKFKNPDKDVPNSVNNNNNIKKVNNSQVVVQDSLKLNITEDELTFVRKLGQGACGEVSQYEWKGTPVAVKIIFKSLLTKDKNGEFEKETQILKCLRHPNVVLFMGTCTLGGNLAIITEYLNRGSLRDVLNNQELDIDWNTKIKMLIDVAQGMNYLHNYNPKIIHRDLKSVNLLVDHSFNVKVSDFGLSRFVSSGTEAKTFCGTLPWIAPEVFAGSGYSTQADVFSFGIVLWEILTRLQPTGSIASSQLGYPELPPDCPVPFANLIKDCCARKPLDRPNFTQILQRLKSMIIIGDSSKKLLGVSSTGTASVSPSGIDIVPQLITTNNNNYDNYQIEKQKLLNWTIDLKDISEVRFQSKEEQFTLLTGLYKGEQVSIKQWPSSVVDFEKKELDLVASLKSPAVVKFIGVVFNKNEHAIISEHMANGSLFSLLQNEQFHFTWDFTIKLAIEMAQSINVLHKFQPTILHRGINNKCFYLDKGFNIKISDFGISRFNIHENSVTLGEIRGNFIYSPPELVKSIKFSTKSDVYSFSIVLWELFHRCITKSYQVPFSNIELEFDFQIIHQTGKLNQRPIINEKIPTELNKLLQRSWDPEPQLRPDFDTIIKTLQDFKNNQLSSLK
eukprot:gene7758-9548_t